MSGKRHVRFRLKEALRKGLTKDEEQNNNVPAGPSGNSSFHSNGAPIAALDNLPKHAVDGSRQDLWQCAYDKLDQKEKEILRGMHNPAQTGKENDHSETRAMVDGVITITEQRYEEYQRRRVTIQRSNGKEIDLRKMSHKTINAALSFKDVVSAVVAFDPTGHAASAWAVVSLGLTMTKNRIDLQNALFDSAECLADVLARCAFIEQNFYHRNPSGKAPIGDAIIRVYRVILQYAEEVLIGQKPGPGRWIVDSVTAVTKQNLTEIQSLIHQEEQNLNQFVQWDQHLQHQETAEKALAKVDELSAGLQVMIQKFSLPIAEGASYDQYEDQFEAQCLPGTRLELLSDILE